MLPFNIMTKKLTILFGIRLYLKYNFKIFLYKNDTKCVTEVEKVTCQQAVGPGWLWCHDTAPVLPWEAVGKREWTVNPCPSIREGYQV